MKKLYYYLILIIEKLANLAENKFATHGLGRSLRQLHKEVGLFKLHSENLKNQKLAAQTNYNDVQVSGGSHILVGFLNIDIQPPADLICDVREGLPLGKSSCKLIFSEHFFEHIDYPLSAKKFIEECYRVLKPGGQIILGVPDARVIIEGYYKHNLGLLEEQKERWYKNRNCLEHINTYIDMVNYVFRDQDDDQKYTSHLWAYDYDKLENLFKQNGFADVKQWEFDEKIANPKRKWGSIYVIATK